MKKYIHITKENRLGLAKLFNCTDRTIWAAITFEKNTMLMARIQKAAIERGGILMNELPEIETFHDYDNYMRQYFPNGAMLEVNKSNGDVDVMFKGECVRHYHNVAVKELDSIQNLAAVLK